MSSLRQIQANRRNALKSTGPKTTEGKQRSRGNALRHGLTAETVIGLLEDAEDYKMFEAAIIADYDAQSAVERELVLRLASLLWRLRRATTMETGLFEIQAEHLHELRQARQGHRESQKIVFRSFDHTDAVRIARDDEVNETTVVSPQAPEAADPAAELTRCFSVSTACQSPQLRPGSTQPL